MQQLCARLAEAGFLHRSGGNWHWMQEAYPADTVSLRSVTSDNFVIIDTSSQQDGKPEVIGEVDFSTALTTVHPKAIYLHQGQQYHVDASRFRRAQGVREARQRGLLHGRDPLHAGPRAEIADRRTHCGTARARAHGDVLVRSQVIGFKKIKFFTNENVGDGKLELPENEMHTTAFWITLERPLLESLPFALSRPPERDVRPAARPGIHGHAAADVRPRDLGTAVGERPASPGVETGEWQEYSTASDDRARMKEFFEPNLYLYDAYPGGIGFSEPLYLVHDLLLRRTRELIAGCPCESGCPSCVGPAGEKSERTKEAALAILDRLCS